MQCTNNQVEYEAIILGLEALSNLITSSIEVLGDSQLVINQLNGDYMCLSPILRIYYETTKNLLSKFDDVTLSLVPRFFNKEASYMAQRASGFRYTEKFFNIEQLTSRKLLPILVNQLPLVNVSNIEIHYDWQKPIIDYLTGLIIKPSRHLRLKSVNYIMYSRVLFKRASDGMLLECLSKGEGI